MCYTVEMAEHDARVYLTALLVNPGDLADALGPVLELALVCEDYALEQRHEWPVERSDGGGHAVSTRDGHTPGVQPSQHLAG